MINQFEGSIFDPDCYIYFHKRMTSQESVHKEVDFIIQALDMKGGDRVLDLPCGYGTYSNLLSKRSFKVTGIDAQPEFIDLARQNAINENVNAEYSVCDMRNIKFKEQFEHVLTLNTSWGYFTHEENINVLGRISKSLVKGGMLLLELMNHSLGDLILRGEKNISAFDYEGNLLIDWRSYLPDVRRFRIKRVYVKDGMRKDSIIEIQNYTLDEMKSELLKVGMEIQNVFGSQKGRPYSNNSYRCVIAAKKM